MKGINIMKRKILSLIAAAGLLLGIALGAASCGKEEAPIATPVEAYTGDGKNILNNELYGASFSDITGLFFTNMNDDFDLQGLLDAYDVGATGQTWELCLKDGLFVFNQDGKTKYAAQYDSDGFKFVSLSEDDEPDSEPSYEIKTIATIEPLLDRIPVIIDSVMLAEEYFGLPEIKESDIVKGDDKLHYLTEGYTDTLVNAVISAYYCITNGISSDELTEDMLATINDYAETFAEASTVKIGIGLTMKNISSLKIDFYAEGIEEYTSDKFEDLNFNVMLTLDSSRDHISNINGAYSTKAAGGGDIDLEFDIDTRFNTKDEFSSIDAKLKLAMSGVNVGSEQTPVIGNRASEISLKFSPLSKTQSIYLSYDEKVAGSDGENSVYSDTGYILAVDSFWEETPELIYTIRIDGASNSYNAKLAMGDFVRQPDISDEALEKLN